MAKKIKIDVEETPFCSECKFYKKECAVRLVDDKPFDVNLLEYFPNEPSVLIEYEKYNKVAIKKVPFNFEIKDRFVPVVSGKYGYEEDTVLFPVSNLRLDQKFNQDIHRRFPATNHVGLMMNARDGFLFGFVKDNWIENLAVKNFDFIFSPNFSFYYNQPSCSTVLNRFLTYKAIAEITSKGIPAVPCVNFLWEEDLKEYSKWLKKYSFKYVYYNLQLSKVDSVFDKGIEYIKLLNKHIDAEIILTGVFDTNRIKVLEKIRPFIYTNSYLNVLSTNRVVWSKKGEKKKDIIDAMFFGDVLRENILNYRKALKGVLKNGKRSK